MKLQTDRQSWTVSQSIFFHTNAPLADSSIAVYEIGIISLCVLYKLPRFVELRWRPVTSIRCISINWSKTVNGISTPLGSWPWSTSGSKSHVKTLLAGCITLGIVSVSRSARSWAGTHGPNKSRTFFFLPARKFISGDCSGWYQANLVNTMSGHRCLSPQNQVQTKLARNPNCNRNTGHSLHPHAARNPSSRPTWLASDLCQQQCKNRPAAYRFFEVSRRFLLCQSLSSMNLGAFGRCLHPSKLHNKHLQVSQAQHGHRAPLVGMDPGEQISCLTTLCPWLLFVPSFSKRLK